MGVKMRNCLCNFPGSATDFTTYNLQFWFSENEKLSLIFLHVQTLLLTERRPTKLNYLWFEYLLSNFHMIINYYWFFSRMLDRQGLEC